MIVLDIETSGGYPTKYGIWQIGALEFENPENQFLEEARIDDEDKIEEEALKVGGKTKEELRDPNKQSQKELLDNFIEAMKVYEYTGFDNELFKLLKNVEKELSDEN